MTYQKPATESVPVFVANVHSTTEMANIEARGWLGGYHRGGVVDQTWLDGLGARLCWITFEAADFTGSALSTAGQTKADLLSDEAQDNPMKVAGVDIVYTDQDVIQVVEDALDNLIPVYWKNDIAPVSKKGWSREWHPFKNSTGTTALSTDFDMNCKVLAEMSAWYRDVAKRRFAVYTQAKGTPMTVTTGSLDELVLPGKFHMDRQLWFCHTQRAAAVIIDGNRDVDNATFESKVGGNADYADHLTNVANVYRDYKIRDGNDAPVFSFAATGNYSMIKVGEVS